MPALVAGIHVLSSKQNKEVDGRNKSRHDERVFLSEHIMFLAPTEWPSTGRQ
jgi:hypothetical protein